MASRFPWVGLGVGAVIGGFARVGVTALHVQGTVGDLYPIGLYAAAVGALIGGVAGLTGRALWGAIVGAALSVAFSLISLPLVGLFSFFGAATFPPWWEMLAVGAIPGTLGGWAEQVAKKRRESEGGVGAPGPR